MIKENEVNKWLLEVEHPAKGDKSIVELGMVEKVEISEGAVTVTLGFSKHRDPLAEYLIGSAKAAIIRNAPEGTVVEVKSIIKNEAAPKKKPGLDLGFEEISGVRHIIGIIGQQNEVIALHLQCLNGPLKKCLHRIVIPQLRVPQGHQQFVFLSPGHLPGVKLNIQQVLVPWLIMARDWSNWEMISRFSFT